MVPSKSNGERIDSGMSDLKKLFSAHIQENILLQRERSDLDFAKEKKLRELNHTENIFLRKYQKYAQPSPRRCSMDAGILRVAEANASRPCSRNEEAISAQKSLGRMAVTSECPYSFDTWNMMVDVDKSFLEKNKNKLLLDECGERKPDIIIPQSTLNDLAMQNHMLPNREKLTNNMPVPSRRNTLTPLEKKPNIHEEDTFDEEILCIQKPKVARPRRHSINPVNLAGSLPKLQKRRGSIDISILSQTNGFRPSFTQKAKSDPDIVTSPDDASEDTIKLNITKKSDSKRGCGTDTRHNIVKSMIEHVTPGCKDDASKFEENGERGILKKKGLSISKPIANAAVFVSGDGGKTERVDKRECLFCDEQLKNDKTSDTNNNSDDSFLPAISKNTSLTGTPENKCSKSVSFNEEPMRARSDSIPSQGTNSPTRKVDKRRRNSMSALQYLVDSHHGAAKLRYIARLSTEMEREAGIVPNSQQEEDNTYAELEKCRYLRVSSNTGGDDSDS